MAKPTARSQPPPPPLLCSFSAKEISAAEQLVQLSESSAEEDDASSTSAASPSEVKEEFCLQRRNHRSRPIADLYSATARIVDTPKKKEGALAAAPVVLHGEEREVY